ncbi:MAG: hypothetical protein Q9159_003081 [Coniocarpon cinnabarinum]
MSPATSLKVAITGNADAPIRVSSDAGLYFCEFRLYSSLAELRPHATKQGRVVFMRIPRDDSPEGTTLARHLMVAYITALADDEILQANALIPDSSEIALLHMPKMPDLLSLAPNKAWRALEISARRGLEGVEISAGNLESDISRK